MLLRGEPPSAEMMGYLRLMQLGGADSFLLEAIFRQDCWMFMLQPVSEANEGAVCGALTDGAREALAGYPSTIEADLALLRSGGCGPVGSREDAAVRVRLGEKEALDACLRFFEERSGNLPRIEYYQVRPCPARLRPSLLAFCS